MQVKSKRALSCTFLFAPSPRGCGNIFIVEVPSNSSTSPCIQMTWRACQLQLEYLQNSSQMLRRKSRSPVLTHRVKCSRGYLQGAFLAFTSPTVQRTCGSLMASGFVSFSLAFLHLQNLPNPFYQNVHTQTQTLPP